MGWEGGGLPGMSWIVSGRLGNGGDRSETALDTNIVTDPPMEHVAPPPSRDGLGSAWADLPGTEVAHLIEESRRVGWRAALRRVAPLAPFFAKRMLGLVLGNWHLLLAKSRQGKVLDVGCGFGSMVLGFGQQYDTAVGIETLRDRVAYGSIRGRQEAAEHVRFVRGSGLMLPFMDGSFQLVTLNGVLEWAGLYDASRDPERAQRDMLLEARRVAGPTGTVAVAIENRYALESLLGLRDTHTGLTWVTLMPRWIANAWSRIRKGEPYRTYLYGEGGYRRLFASAGFQAVRVFDLISSYNDYDFIVETTDSASYRFITVHDLHRPFYEPIRFRRMLGRFGPNLLGKVSYAYLVVGGTDDTTVLDERHRVWQLARDLGIDPGAARFACQTGTVGVVHLLSHDGRKILGLIELGSQEERVRTDMPSWLLQLMGSSPRLVGSDQVAGLTVRAYAY